MIGQNSEQNYIESQLSRSVLEESCLGNLIYFLKYMLELSYHNKKIFQECRALNFKWNALTARISWQHMHSKLVSSWHLFTFFTGAPFLCTQCVTLSFCFILDTCLAHAGSKNFIFHAILSSRETFQTLAWKFLLCVLQKIFSIYIFPYFVLK